jgi:hypothetical protein
MVSHDFHLSLIDVSPMFLTCSETSMVLLTISGQEGHNSWMLEHSGQEGPKSLDALRSEYVKRQEGLNRLDGPFKSQD